MIRMSLNVKSQGAKKSRFFPKRLATPNLICETLYIADYQYVNVASFVVLDLRLIASLATAHFYCAEKSSK